MDCTILTNMGKLIPVRIGREVHPKETHDDPEFNAGCDLIHKEVRRTKAAEPGSYQVRSIGALVVPLECTNLCICA